MCSARCDTDTLDLNGWWHAWYDEAAARPAQDAGAPDARPPLSCPAPTAGWDGMEDGMESQRVPGTWAESRPGYRGVVWYWRPVAVPEGWSGKRVYVRFEGVRQQAQVFINQTWVGQSLRSEAPFEVDLGGRVAAGEVFVLAVRVTFMGAPDGVPAGGIVGDVTLCAA